MPERPRILAVVLARGGSTRLPRKNLAVLGGKTLVEHAVLAAKDDGCDRIVVSSDDPEIGAVGAACGADWIRRPDAISGPDADIADAIRHTLKDVEETDQCQYDLVAGLQAAVPVRPIGCIRQLCDHVWENKSNGGLTMIRRKPWIWKVEGGQMSTWFDPAKYPRSQDITKAFYEEVNAVQVAPRKVALAGQRWGWPLSVLELPAWADVDIDTAADMSEVEERWALIERLVSRETKFGVFRHDLAD
jgi:CMP-N-acetylneuraminic acid synthetase